MKRLQGFICGFLAAVVLLISIPALAASIDVIFNPLSIVINGVTATNKGENYTLANGSEVPFSLVYKGTTYLPLRKLAELTGKDIVLDSETDTVHLNDKVITYNPKEEFPEMEGDIVSENKHVTKKELAKFFVESFEPVDRQINRKYIDVPQTDEFYEYIAIAVNNGYIPGSGNYFTPNVPITRTQYAMYLCNILKRMGDDYTPNGITDIGFAFEETIPAIETVVSLGLMELYDDGTFRPKDPLIMDLTPNKDLQKNLQK